MKPRTEHFVPGFRFNVRQASLTSRPREYVIVYELDDECRPIRVGGVKPRPDTTERVNRLVANHRSLRSEMRGEPVKSNLPQCSLYDLLEAYCDVLKRTYSK